MQKRSVYADNAATTRVSESVLSAMLPVFTEDYGNPSSVHSAGRSAARLLMQAGERTAGALGCRPNEVYFTCGGTESDNWAVKSAAELGAADGKRRIVTTAIEHHAVLRPCEMLEKQGFEVTYLKPDSLGVISAEQVEEALGEDVCLVSVMAANNETGTLQPVSEIGRLCRSRGILFHTDAVQAVGNIPINVQEMNIDLLSLSGHKIHAPKGVGALYIRSGVRLPAFMLGGEQQRGRRAGTENLPGIVGLGQALYDCTQDMDVRTARLTALRNRLTEGLLNIPETRLNGHPTQRLCGNVNISVAGVEGESLLLMLETMGIYASSGAACASGSLEPSHVLTAMGLPEELARGSLRLTLGSDTTDEDIDYLIYSIARAVERIRERSPLWARIKKEKGL